MNARNRIGASSTGGSSAGGSSSSSSSGPSATGGWRGLALCMIILILPWALYVNLHTHTESQLNSAVTSTTAAVAAGAGAVIAAAAGGGGGGVGGTIGGANPGMMGQIQVHETKATKSKPVPLTVNKPAPAAAALPATSNPPPAMQFPDLPVLGPIPSEGSKPLFGMQHKGTDAIMALACKYPTIYYKRFVGSLRKAGFTEDIVLAVSPVSQMKPGVEQYLKSKEVVAYGFDVECKGPDNCKLQDEFLGYPDPRPHRTFANIRYALYEYWLRHYSDKSYILILDFRDTFFQGNPFQAAGSFEQRTPKFELQMFAENYKVKNIGICVFNSNWIKTCFGKPALEALRPQAVICSGSTLGSFWGVKNYVRTMLQSMDSVKCWLKGIESDQGYQNYLFYNGHFNTAAGNATLNHQGYGAINTIGAMNGFRVPKEKKGPLDTFWKIRDSEGYVLNYDGTRSACVHQWDRWYKELAPFIDSKTY